MPAPYHVPKGQRTAALADQDMESWWQEQVDVVDTDIQDMIDDLGCEPTEENEEDYPIVVYCSPPPMGEDGRLTMDQWGSDPRFW